MSTRRFGWLSIARVGLVQASLGSVVVLATSTLNRVMVVEWSLPAIIPGLLVALHYATQILRPRWGHGSDRGGRRTPWIVGGMAALSIGGVTASAATALMGTSPIAGLLLAVLAYSLIGMGVGASGTSLLVLLAKQVAPARRPAAASIVWIMMIAGFGITAGLAGRMLDPFSPARLIAVTAVVCAITFVITLLAVWRIETLSDASPAAGPQPGFVAALRQVWAEPRARRFTMFVFVSMLAYSAQELVLEPFAGLVLRWSPGATTSLTGLQHGGALVGMLLVAVAGSVFAGRLLGSTRFWTLAGCAGSAACLIGLAASGLMGEAGLVRGWVFTLGVANGAFAVAAIGAMMALVAVGRSSREGVRMGLWGAAQAVAFALGGLFGGVASDVARAALATPAMAYGAVFLTQAALFGVAAWQAAQLFQTDRPAAPSRGAPAGLIPEAG